MTPDEALTALTEQAARYLEAQQTIETERQKTVDAIVAALRAGARPTDVDQRSPFTATYNRRRARAAGVPPKPKTAEH